MNATADPRKPWIQNLIRIVLSGCLIAFSSQILAQEEGEDDEDEADDEPTADELVVVTGSRLKRDTYSSIAPLQIITAEVSREVGLIDAGDILRDSTASAGQQVDLTFQGYVLDNGPGATEVSFRGLGASRTLLLINGRRMAPSGVEGAPSFPDPGLIPGSLVAQYDLLLDGASSVYGSDAIGGVANIILRKDFNGLELGVFPTLPHHENGFRPTASATWGRNFDRGFVGIGAEWSKSEPVTLDDRPWTEGCRRNAEIDQSGRRRSEELFYSVTYGMTSDGCLVGSLAGRVSVPRAGSIYYTPGSSNGGWPNFSESSLYGGIGIDGDGDGNTDINFRDYDLNGREQFAHLFPEREQLSVMAYGEYTLEGDMNLTPFFEVLYVEREFFSDSGAAQLFPTVPARNPFNLCNPEAENGVDCGLAWNALMNNPNFLRQFTDYWVNLNGCFGLPASICVPASFGVLSGPLGPQSTLPIVSVRGDRTQIEVEQDQLRLVAGVQGDLPWLNFGGFRNWTFDFAVVHTKSEGASRRPGIRDDRLDLALGVYSTTNTPCENDTGEPLAADAAQGCVPVNMFAPSLYPASVVGDFATAAERNYVFDDRDFDTVYQQTLISYYMTGNVFQLPADWIVGGFGFEYRIDDIDSIPDAVARDGLFFGFFADGGAVGDKYTREIFGELEIPIIAGQPAAEELVVNVSARWTDDEFYGAAWTHSYKMAYRPINSLLFRATSGTSYRAPNLRELFLQPQTGFLNVFDPCLLPADALNDLTGDYIPENDRRDDIVLENCRANGVDPTVASNNGFNVYNVEVAAGGFLDLDEETSESLSAGFAWKQPFTNAFDLSIGATYYEIEINDSIIEPSAGFIVFDCYNSPTGNSPFCPRIQRESDPAQPLINYIDRSFINRDSEIARGVDVNIAFEDTWTIFGRAIDIVADLNFHRQIERSTLFINDEGEEDFDEFQKEWGFPERTARLDIRADYGKWRFVWSANYLAKVDQDADGLDDFAALDGGSDSCLGPPDDLLCRDVGFADEYLTHQVSLSWRGDTWVVLGGIRNVFDEAPPVVDGTEILSTNNTPIGYGYDVYGRAYFFTVLHRFGGS